MRRPSATALAVVAVLGLILSAASPAHAGGGPESVLIVVNADSADSLQVANEYVDLRRVPRGNVVHLTGIPSKQVISIDEFRTLILAPIRAAIADRGLEDEIDIIAYSAGFPHGVDYQADHANPKAPLSKIASLTGLTFLARRVERKDTSYLDLQVNRYFRREGSRSAPGPTRQPSDAERKLAEAANAAIRDQDWETAAARYAELVKSWDGHAGTFYNQACALARLGRTDEAFAALERAVTTGWRDAAHTTADGDLESLRGDDRFAALLARMKASATGLQPARGFAATDVWTGADAPERGGETDSLDRYWLSVMLGYTGPLGNTVDEVIACLRRAAESDGTNPRGTVYLMKNEDVRSKTRQPSFGRAIEALDRLGRKAIVLAQGEDGQDGTLPIGKDDVIGLVAGRAGFNWGKSRSKLLPGAIAEHLTSFGAAFQIKSQTKISEFIRAGAAGSAGTVAEPYAIQAKFPTPFLHAFYAEGCSLAEAFYQSVSGPHQLLIVGDPLARPFAHFARVSFGGPDPSKPWSGAVSLEASVTAAKGRPIDRVELWVDGERVARAAPGEPIAWDTSTVDDGSHDLRLVAIEAGPIETRSFEDIRISIENAKKTPRVSLRGPRGAVPTGAALAISGKARGAREVRILDGARVIETVKVRGGNFKTTIDADTLGAGEVELVAHARLKDDRWVRSEPMTVEITRAAASAPEPSGKKKRRR